VLVVLGDGWLLDLETRGWARKEHPHEDKPRLVKDDGV